MIVFDSDDFGCNHEISDMCQSHDCRDVLLELKKINPAFKATLFAIPGEMTPELLLWCKLNSSWIELAVHGFYHVSNYECEKISYRDFHKYIMNLQPIIDDHFVRGFKAPGWQISDDALRWLKDYGWWVADQAYNNVRRPEDLPVYIINDDPEITSIHTHTWNCVGNGVYELYDQLVEQIKDETEFKFVSEVVK
jgi:peptidoglycan/xylan/chitin deacetylase (PgdA/CDA1 family)